MPKKKIPDPVNQVLPDWRKDIDLLAESTANRGKNLAAELEGRELSSCWNCKLLIEEYQLIKHTESGLTSCPRCGFGWVEKEYVKTDLKNCIGPIVDWNEAQVPFRGGEYFTAPDFNPINDQDFIMDSIIRLAPQTGARAIEIEHVEFNPNLSHSNIGHQNEVVISRSYSHINVLGRDEPVEMIPIWQSSNWIPLTISGLYPVRPINAIMGSEIENDTREEDSPNPETTPKDPE